MYQHGKRTKPPFSFRILLGVAAIVGMTLIVTAVILSKDLGNRTTPVTGAEIVTEIGEDGSDKIKIDEPLFYMELPVDWKLQERRNDENINFYAWVSTRQGGADRKLTLYIDRLPQNHKLVRLLPLTSSNDRFILGNVSDDCANFVNVKGTEPVEAKWENVAFMCDPIINNQTIGTGTEQGGIAANLKGHKYFFFYEDHNIYPEDSILIQALKSFRAR